MNCSVGVSRAYYKRNVFFKTFVFKCLSYLSSEISAHVFAFIIILKKILL